MATMTTPVTWPGPSPYRPRNYFGSVDLSSSTASSSKIPQSVRPPLPPIPLPAIPDNATRPRQQKSHSIHTSRPTLSRSSSSNSLRPLPPVPCATSLPPVPKKSTRVSMRPLPPVPHIPSNLMTAPRGVRPLPTRRDSLRDSLTMESPAPPYVAFLESSASDASSVTAAVSPLSLSPAIAERKSITDLRCPSGESLPQEVAYGVSDDGTIVVSPVLDKVREIGEFEVASGPSFNPVDEEKEEDSEDESDTDSDFDDDLQEQATVQVIERRLVMMGATTGAYQSAITRRHSRQWIREQGGRRWVEDDYADVIRSLRRL